MASVLYTYRSCVKALPQVKTHFFIIKDTIIIKIIFVANQCGVLKHVSGQSVVTEISVEKNVEVMYISNHSFLEKMLEPFAN